MAPVPTLPTLYGVQGMPRTSEFPTCRDYAAAFEPLEARAFLQPTHARVTSRKTDFPRLYRLPLTGLLTTPSLWRDTQSGYETRFPRDSPIRCEPPADA